MDGTKQKYHKQFFFIKLLHVRTKSPIITNEAGHSDKAKPGEFMNHSEEKIVAKALKIIARNLRQPGYAVSSPDAVKNYLIINLAREEREIFGVLWLDVRNKVISIEHLFFGTLTNVTVPPREILKSGLKNNSSAAIIYHCHPSGSPFPSDADKSLTRSLQKSLEIIDIRLLDHIIVGGMNTYSFAENGLI